VPGLSLGEARPARAGPPRIAGREQQGCGQPGADAAFISVLTGDFTRTLPGMDL
jgi:hypothetical protein